MMARINRRLAAIIAADVVGYSRLMGLDEEGTLAALRTHRKSVIDPLVKKHKGHMVKTTGDGLLLEFSSVVQAVACAVAIQRQTAELNKSITADRRITFRIGVNLGDVIIEDGDVFGDGVNVAARLEPLAKPGDICVSDDVYRQIEGKLDFEIRDGGEKRLKNIRRPVRIHHIVTASSGSATATGSVDPWWKCWWSGPLIGGSVALMIALAAASFWYWSSKSTPDKRPARDIAGETGFRDALPIIAILPFANLTGDKQQEYFADGFTDELISALGRFNTLRVIGRNAVSAYKVHEADNSEIASKLGASYFVEGGVRASKDRLRLAVRLIGAPKGTVLWSDQFDGSLSDIFRFQDTITRHIAGTLAVNITQIEGQKNLDKPKPDQGAYDLVLKGRAIGYGKSRKANREFRELMTRAIEIDPNYATAHALLAEGIFARLALGWTEFATRDAQQGETHAREAIKLAPNEPDGFRALGRYHLLRADYDAAKNALERAIEINPSDSDALAMQGAVKMFSGDMTGAIEVLELALKYNPSLESFFVFDLSLAYYFAEQHDDALRMAEQGISQFQDFPAFYVSAAAAAARLGKLARARGFVQEIRRRMPFLELNELGSRFKDPKQIAYLKDGLNLAGF